MLTTLLLVLTLIYALMIIAFTAGAAASQYPTDLQYRPRVSIIVAARNEEDKIAECLNSLSALTYPHNLLELILVDDRSTDATPAIVRQYMERCPYLRLVQIGAETELRPGKMNAVTQGIDASTGEILLFTDADCRVPKGWVENIVKYYTDSSIGTVAGFTSLLGTGLFSRLQALDWFYLFSVAAATARMRFPVTAVGTNLSVRRAAYESVGGYRKIPFSVTEDYALFHAVTEAGFHARFPRDMHTLVETFPCASWKQLYSQKVRWFTGGRGMDVKSLLIFAFPYIFNLLIAISAILFEAPLLYWAIGVKLLVDLVLFLPSLSTFKRISLLRSFFAFELYYYCYVLIFPPLVLFGKKVEWKERTFE